jgi:hypothetical protein
MIKQPFKEGKKREDRFVNDLISHNSNIEYVRDSTEEEDIERHFDKILKNIEKDVTFKVDAKSPSKFGDKYFWVEDMAVYARNKYGIPRLGSIHGEADWMAWEMSDHWLMGRRTYLEHIMDAKVDKSNPIIEPRAKGGIDTYLYKLRGREDRGDRCSLFFLDDLDKKHFRKIPKQKTKTFINELF